MRTELNQICFSTDYKKLTNLNFHTVRWTDKAYVLGKVYDLWYMSGNMYHAKYSRGKARLMKLEIVKIRELSDSFIKTDADCDRFQFLKLMEGWYKNKPDWKGEDSEVQILYLTRVADKLPEAQLPLPSATQG